jgi:hypothetical protein
MSPLGKKADFVHRCGQKMSEFVGNHLVDSYICRMQISYIVRSLQRLILPLAPQTYKKESQLLFALFANDVYVHSTILFLQCHLYPLLQAL